MITLEQLQAFAPRPQGGNRADIWDAYAEALSEHGNELFAQYGVDQPLELQHFLAQIAHESGGLTVLWEDMSYSAGRIMQIFGAGVHSAMIGTEEARGLAKNPKALAERVYGLGNPRKSHELGNTEPGDGYKYRGFGLMQTTGKAAHERLIGGDYTAVGALRAALREWDDRHCNELACQDNLKRITKLINGGYNGLPERARYLAKAKRIFATTENSSGAPVTETEIAQVSSKAKIAVNLKTGLKVGAGIAAGAEAVSGSSDSIAAWAGHIEGLNSLTSAVITLAGFLKAHALIAFVIFCAVLWWFLKDIVRKIIADLLAGRYTPSMGKMIGPALSPRLPAALVTPLRFT